MVLSPISEGSFSPPTGVYQKKLMMIPVSIITSMPNIALNSTSDLLVTGTFVDATVITKHVNLRAQLCCTLRKMDGTSQTWTTLSSMLIPWGAVVECMTTGVGQMFTDRVSADPTLSGQISISQTAPVSYTLSASPVEIPSVARGGS